MQQRRLLIGLMIGTLALMALLPVIGVRAQSTQTFDFDFTSTDGGAASYITGTAGPLQPSTYVAGSGWQSGYTSNYGGYYALWIRLAAIPGFQISSVTAVWTPAYGCSLGNGAHEIDGDGHITFTGNGIATAGNLPVGISGRYEIYLETLTCPITLTSLHLEGYGASTPTYTPSPTPTITPTAPIGGFVPVGITCQLIQTETANFNNLPGAWQLSPESGDGPGNPTGQTKGLHLPQGSATLNNLSLSSAHKYKIDLSFHVGNSLLPTDTPSATPSDTPTPSATPTGTPSPGDPPVSGTIFGVTFGKSPTYNVQVNGALGPQSFTIPAANYIPDEKSGDADIFHLKLENLLYPDGNNTLVIDSVCVSDTTPGQGVVSTAPPQGECKTCNRPTDLLDIGGWIQWLGCGLGQLFDCVLKGLLMGLWKTIVNILQFLSFIRQWVGLIFQNGSGWLVNVLRVLWAWLSGAAGNILIVAGNILAGLLNGLGLTRLINTILTVLTVIPSLIANLISGGVQFIVNTADTIGAFWGIITYWATKMITLIGGVIGAVPIMISALVAGLNASATTIPTWAPSCTSTNTFFYGFCLTSYIIDNTIFDGPLYLVVPVIMGFVGWLTILWTMNKIKRAVAG